MPELTDAKRKQTGAGKSLAPITNHGTTGGYKRHLYRREVPCEDCLLAERDRSREQHRVRRAQQRRKGAAS